MRRIVGSVRYFRSALRCRNRLLRRSQCLIENDHTPPFHGSGYRVISANAGKINGIVRPNMFIVSRALSTETALEKAVSGYFFIPCVRFVWFQFYEMLLRELFFFFPEKCLFGSVFVRSAFAC